MTTSPNDPKQFALEVLDVIDELIKPEIKYNWISSMWSYFTGYAKKKILVKPDNEIIEKLLILHKKLNGKFGDLHNSVEINKAEKLGSVKIPMVGELARVKKLTQTNIEQAEELAKELLF